MGKNRSMKVTGKAQWVQRVAEGETEGHGVYSKGKE